MRAIFGTSLIFFAAIAVPAQAQVVFSDGFEGQGTSGVTNPNFNGFSNFFAPPDEGAVDLIQSGQSGVTCFSGARCVDLDGSTGNAGTLVSRTLYSFNAGDTIDLTFQISGNQRNPGPDLWFGGFFNLPIPFYNNAGPIVASSFFGDAGCGAFVGGTFTNNSAVMSSGPAGCVTNGGDPFSLRRLGFVAGAPGVFRLVFGDYTTGQSDGQGAILDDVQLSITPAVPEPSSWAMMLLGMGLVGWASRRKRVKSTRADASARFPAYS